MALATGVPRVSSAMYTPETTVLGTAHEADTPQLPRSTRLVAEAVRQLGWFCGSDADGVMLATLRAPLPW